MFAYSSTQQWAFFYLAITPFLTNCLMLSHQLPRSQSLNCLTSHLTNCPFSILSIVSFHSLSYQMPRYLSHQWPSSVSDQLPHFLSHQLPLSFLWGLSCGHLIVNKNRSIYPFWPFIIAALLSPSWCLVMSLMQKEMASCYRYRYSCVRYSIMLSLVGLVAVLIDRY